jgi:nucleoside-diphosphate-sugar epimerase
MPRAIAVLVTGSAGRIGSAVCSELAARGHRVRGLDIRPTPGVADNLVGSLADAELAQRAVRGLDAVVHLAAIPHDADFLTQLLPNNVIAVHNLLDAIRAAGVKRLVLASSAQVNAGHTGAWPVTPATPTRPRNWYATAKLFAEHAAEAYAHQYGVSVIVARSCWCPRTREDAATMRDSEFDRDQYLSPGDAGRFFSCAVEASLDIRFAVLYATSRPIRKTRFDIQAARELIGYEPRDQFPQGLESLL